MICVFFFGGPNSASKSYIFNNFLSCIRGRFRANRVPMGALARRTQRKTRPSAPLPQNSADFCSRSDPPKNGDPEILRILNSERPRQPQNRPAENRGAARLFMNSNRGQKIFAMEFPSRPKISKKVIAETIRDKKISTKS